MSMRNFFGRASFNLLQGKEVDTTTKKGKKEEKPGVAKLPICWLSFKNCTGYAGTSTNTAIAHIAASRTTRG
jgi:hypothetical protein